ncbi:hypothetical protein MMC21_002492 [Puttea exsequens]|nr:hypothetical protein [Puttea exsequens]
MADEEEWKPNGRPQSTIARNFSASLNDAFAIDSKLDDLAQSVEQKKQAVNSQNAELEALEAKLRETEDRLKQRQSRNSSPSGINFGNTSSPLRRRPLAEAFGGQENERAQPAASSPLAREPMTSSSQGVMNSTLSQWRPQKNDNSRDFNTVEESRGQQSNFYEE